MVIVGTGGRGTAVIRTDYPVVEGTTAGTTKLKEEWKLEAENKSLVYEKDKTGID